MCMAAALLVGPIPDSDEVTRRQPAVPQRIVGVVGQWSDTTVGGPAVILDGERWTGHTDVDALRRQSERLFGMVDSSMIAEWSAPTAYPIAIAPDVGTFSAGTLRVQFNLLGGRSDQVAGVVFGLRADGAYHYVRHNTRDGNVALWRYAGGARTRVAAGQARRQLSLNSWHELIVTIRDGVVHGAVAGDSTLSITHEMASAPVGFTGLWAKRDAVTMFRGFEARASSGR